MTFMELVIYSRAANCTLLRMFILPMIERAEHVVRGVTDPALLLRHHHAFEMDPRFRTMLWNKLMSL